MDRSAAIPAQGSGNFLWEHGHVELTVQVAPTNAELRAVIQFFVYLGYSTQHIRS